MTFKSVLIITLGLFNFVFFTLAAGASYRSLGRVNRNANTFRCPSEGIHADPVDCRIFYRCVDWNLNVFFRDVSEPALAAFQFICGEGTVFDPGHNVCKHPQETSRRECGGRATQYSADNLFPFSYSSAVDTGDGNPYQENGYASYQYYEVSTDGPDRYPNEYENEISPEVDRPPSSGECTSEGFFPVPGNCKMFMRCTDGGSGGYRKFLFRCGEGTVWDQKNLVCNYPSAVPGCGGTNGNSPGDEGGYPVPDGSYDGNGQYPDQQGNGPDRPGFPQQGNYPGQESYPGQTQSQGNEVGQSGFPQQGNQGSSFGEASDTNQGYPGQDYNRPPPVAYPEQENQGGYPGRPGQINNPDRYPQGGYPVQQGPGNGGNGPDHPGYPQRPIQGGYPGQVNRPSSVGYPDQQGNRPDQSSNTRPTGYPDSYPNQNVPGQPSFPTQGYPQGGYPGTDEPDQNQGYPTQGPEEFGNGNAVQSGNPNECQTDGFFSVAGDCTRFFRCADNAMGGYIRYDFICGPGTVWDQESLTCNHPWAVQRKDCSTGTVTESSADTSRSTSSQQQTTSNQNWSQSSSSSQTTSSFYNFTQSTSTSSSSYFNSSSSSSSSSSTQGQTSSSSQNQMTTSSQQGQSQSTSNQQGSQSSTNQQTGTEGPNGATTPMTPENRPTSMRPQQETTTESGNTSASPPGSKPSQPDGNSPVKCERAGFYAVPGNCKKFYRCVDWDGDRGERFSVYYFECAEGTIWDPALETCNHEESVYPPRECSGKQENGSQSESVTDKNTDVGESTTSSETDESTTEVPADEKPIPTTESTESSFPSTDGGATTAPTQTENSETTTQPPFESTAGQTAATSETSETTNPTEPIAEGETNPTSQRPDGFNERPNQTLSECVSPGEGQVAFVCPTGFRRHPKECSLFYQCTISKEGDVNVMTLSCKNETVYDERKIQCLPQDETDPCPSRSGGRTRFYRRVEPEMTSVVPIPSSETLCPGEGNFPYQGDCQRFFKCQKDEAGKLQGYLYQCPEKYSFSESSGSCKKSSGLPKCSRSLQYLTSRSLKWMTSKVPIEIVR